MKLKDLIELLSPYQDIQLGDSKTGEPLNTMSYIADSACDIVSYEDYDVYGIAPKVNQKGEAYLAILLEMRV